MRHIVYGCGVSCVPSNGRLLNKLLFIHDKHLVSLEVLIYLIQKEIVAVAAMGTLVSHNSLILGVNLVDNVTSIYMVLEV